MKKIILGLILASCANNVLANNVTMRFLNCTGNPLIINWLGFKVNVDAAASNSVKAGTITLPAQRMTVIKNLDIFYGTGPNSHTFDLDFVQGTFGYVDFTWHNDETISAVATNNIYLPNTSIASDKSTIDIQIGCN